MSNIFPEDKKWFDGQPSIKKVAAACIAVLAFVFADSIGSQVFSGTSAQADIGFLETVFTKIIPIAIPLFVGFLAVSYLFPDMPENPSG